MTIERPILFIDMETTGVDLVKDRIVEIGVCSINPDGRRGQWSKRFNPGIPISAEATAVHGITDEDVADCDPFSAWAGKIAKALSGKDLAGYNLWRLDLPILDEELRRCGHKLDVSHVNVIDCFGIYQKKRPRRLEDAVREFCGREHHGAHGALADANATADVLRGQLALFPDLGSMSTAELAEFSRQSDYKVVDLAGKLVRDATGAMLFAFGQHRGRKVADHLDYARWMLNKDFPSSTKEALQDEIALYP